MHEKSKRISARKVVITSFLVNVSDVIENPALAVVALLFATGTNGYALSLSLRRLVGKRSMSRIWNIFWQTPLVETKNALIQDLMGTSSDLE